MDTNELKARIERAGDDEMRAVLQEALDHLTAKSPPPPDYDALERDEIFKVRHGDHRTISQIQSKYNQLRNPRPAPVAPVDHEIEAAKSAGTLEQLYAARMAKIRHGDVSAITALKREFRKSGLEKW